MPAPIVIAYLFTVEATHDALLRDCINRLRGQNPDCRIAVFDSQRSPLPRRPSGSNFYRIRPKPDFQWDEELALLAATAHAFPGARWIARVHDLATPPLKGAEVKKVDFWACPGGYFLRRSIVRQLTAHQEARNAEPIKAALAEVVIAAGGVAAQGSGGGMTFEYRAEPRLSSLEPMAAQAFAAVATAEMADEAEILVRTLRRHHDEPLVLACDEMVVERVSALGFSDIEFLRISPAMREHAEAISRRVVRHNPYWKPEAIALKFPVLRHSIEKHGPTHLLDADIVVNASLHQGGPWSADLVLSPHYEQDIHAPWVVAHGFFNAGYLMVRHSEIVDRWEEMYREGIGGFYEQKCLDRLDREFVATWFGPEHNFGRWRWESPERRPIVSLHHKLSLGRLTRELGDLADAVIRALSNAQPPLC